MDDDFVDLPEHSRLAAIKALFRRDTRSRELAVLDAAASQSLVDGGQFTDDPDRRALFLSDVARRVMLNGTMKTQTFLRRLYHFSKAQAMAVIKEARIELAADMATAREELRGVANARIEDIMRRAVKACDIGSEIKAMKEWLRLHGLYVIEGAGLGDYAALMRKITAEADASIVEAEFYVKDETEPGEAPQSWALPERVHVLEEDKDDNES